ncbi:hypothetical protein [Yoonia sp.]|uniref:hypothetical protein n=1 Tax=Yoonia sp. TaxID=2212373 RepID=UPI00358DEDA5
MNILGGLDHATSGRVWRRDTELPDRPRERTTCYGRVTDPMPAKEVLAQVSFTESTAIITHPKDQLASGAAIVDRRDLE